MLKQILRDMYVDPEILAALDETHKQTLFCKMREEQVRRWKLWDEKCDNYSDLASLKPCNKTKANKSVQWRVGDDGEPWVWVMGEHPTDLTIDEILANEAKEKARQLAEEQTVELRKSYNDADLTKLIEFEPEKKNDSLPIPKIEECEIYCSVDELRERIAQNHIKNEKNSQNNSTLNNRLQFNFSDSKPDILKEIPRNKPTFKVSARIAQWEQRVIGEKATEILEQIQLKQREAAKEAEEYAKRQEELWKEQERRAKEAEVQRRQIARIAREEHRKSITIESCDSMDFSGISKPEKKADVVNWYRTEELPRSAGLVRDNEPAKWFHGLLSRLDAESLLASEPEGTFLVRLSEKIWGYAISYKDVDRCKHYLIESANGNYQFLGTNQRRHQSLSRFIVLKSIDKNLINYLSIILDELIEFHATNAITTSGNECLKYSCASEKQDLDSILQIG